MVRLFLKQQVNVIDSQRSKLLIGTLQVEQKTSEGHKDSPGSINVSFCESPTDGFVGERIRIKLTWYP